MGGWPHASATVGVEVTIRKEAEATQAGLLAAMADQPLLGVAFLRGPDLVFETANDLYRKIVGGRDVVGKALHEALPELEGQGLDALMRRVLQTGEAYVGREFHVRLDRRGQGVEDAYYDFVYQPVRGPDQAHAGILLITHDVTEAVLARQEAQRAKEEQARLVRQRSDVLEAMGDAFFTLDPAFRITLVNAQQERVSRLPREQTLGRTFWEVWPETAKPDSKYWTEYQRCMRERVPVRFLEYYAPLDIWTDVRAYPTPEGGIAVFFRDVSDEKRVEAALQAQAEFEQQLVGIVSHDLRTPLTAIQVITSHLLKGELDERTTQGLVRVQASVDRATRLVRDLLDFTQARLGQGIPIQRKDADLHEVLERAVEEVRGAFPEREVAFTTEGEGAGSWDADRLSQVLHNLATNALKYSPRGTVVRISSRGTGGEVVLEVHNSGEPIPASLLPAIFKPLQRGAQVPERKAGSIGLGLFIVEQIVRAHGGSVSVRSTAEEGTVFQVRLPRNAVA